MTSEDIELPEELYHAYTSTSGAKFADTWPIPDTVFHYTSAPGMLGIIENGQLWATDLAFLNDAQEIKHGVSLFRNELTKLITDVPAYDVIISQILEEKNLFAFQRLMVSCYCLEGDLLSQWRGYGGAGGYSIGFDSTRLGPILTEKYGMPFPLRPVIYSHDYARKITRSWARQSSEDMTEIKELAHLHNGGTHPPEERVIEEMARAFANFDHKVLANIIQGCTMLKNQAFREEREWRTVLPVARRELWGEKTKGPKMEFRQGQMGITPFVRLDLKDENGLMPIKKIYVGPGHDADARADAIEMILETNGYKNTVEIATSAAPFRPS